VNGHKGYDHNTKELKEINSSILWLGQVMQKGLSKQKQPKVIVNQTTAWNGYAKGKYVN
jgi:hypothetical protein